MNHHTLVNNVMLILSGESPYPCKQCGERFWKKENYDVHAQTCCLHKTWIPTVTSEHTENRKVPWTPTLPEQHTESTENRKIPWTPSATEQHTESRKTVHQYKSDSQVIIY